MTNRTYRPSAADLLAAHALVLRQAGAFPHTELIDVDTSVRHMAIPQEWIGREIKKIQIIRSSWKKMWNIIFYWVDSTEEKHARFTLTLNPTLTKDEVKQIAETYLIVLNSRRKQWPDQ